ncbi:clostripain-related cysteine peptidase [Thiospirochaeta perfilievii]|nr:clostripain-related cysteine peptidase [Thiospirochaeta perfilievii]
MIYVSGSGNLEGESLLDVTSMVDGYSKNINKNDLDIVILHDRGPGFSTDQGDWTGTYLYEVTDSGLKTINSVESWRDSIDQEESMGSQDTLDNFLTWAISNHSREKQALILWNHGGGLSGQSIPEARAVSWDTEDSGDNINEALYVYEIQDTLKKHYNNQTQLDLLGFDACYMGMLEIGYEFKNIVNYMIASPAEETGGWRYNDFIEKISKESLAEQIAKEIVSSYSNYSSTNNLPNTLTAFNLNEIEEVKDIISHLVENIKALTDSEVLALRQSSMEYYPEADSVLYPYIDIGYFADQLSEFSSLELNLLDLKKSLNRVIVSSFNNLHSNTLENYMGISIFFPEQKDDYKYQWWYTADDTGTFGNVDFCIDTSWKALMNRYFN